MLRINKFRGDICVFVVSFYTGSLESINIKLAEYDSEKIENICIYISHGLHGGSLGPEIW